MRVIQHDDETANAVASPFRGISVDLELAPTYSQTVIRGNVRPKVRPVEGGFHDRRLAPDLNRGNDVPWCVERLRKLLFEGVVDRLVVTVPAYFDPSNAGYRIDPIHGCTPDPGGAVSIVNARALPQPRSFRSPFVRYRSPVGFV